MKTTLFFGNQIDPLNIKATQNLVSISFSDYNPKTSHQNHTIITVSMIAVKRASFGKYPLSVY